MTIGLFGILTIIFVVAKLFGLITWSWWLVLLPAWLPTVVAIALTLIVTLIATYKE